MLLAELDSYADRRVMQDAVRSERGLEVFTRAAFLARRGFRWVNNWHHQVIFDALMRVYRGETTRLIINIPPRYSKTEIAVVCFIAWGLGMAPDAEFIHTSYSASLALGNSANARDLVMSDVYRAFFPGIRVSADAKSKGDWHTTEGGVVYATGSGGSLTGFGAGKMRSGFGGCFPYGQLVETERGPIAIGDIVTRRLPVRVWSWNERDGRAELAPIDTFWTNPGNDVIEITLDDGSALSCTPNHKLLTDSGWLEARELAQALDLVDRQPGFFGGLRARLARVGGDLAHALRVLRLGVPGGVGQAHRDARPRLPQLDLANHACTDAEPRRQRRGAVPALEDFHRLSTRQLCAGAPLQRWQCAVPQGVLHIVGLRSPREVFGGIVGLVAVKVAGLVAGWARAGKSLKHKVRDIAQRHHAADRQVHALVTLPVVAGLDLAQRDSASDAPRVGHIVEPGSAVNRAPRFVRRVGRAAQTFCLEIRGNHNFILAQSGAIVSNCIIIDDPHKADEARSDTMRKNVIDWFTTTVESRKNDPKRTPIILIMQRLHEADLAGFLLAGGNGEKWEHVSLPAIQPDGTALWPAKHSIEQLRVMERANPYVFAGQYQQRPAPLAGGEFKPDAMPVIEAIPAGTRFVRAWDLAGTDGGGDYTAGAMLGVTPAGRYVVADMVRVQEGPDGVEATLKATAQRDSARITVAIPQDPGQAGKAQIRALTRLLSGFAVSSKPVSGDKITRARPFAAQVNVGNVDMVAGGWNDALVKEMRDFPNGLNDDQIDALSLAFDELTGGNTGLIDFYRSRAEEEARLRDAAQGPDAMIAALA